MSAKIEFLKQMDGTILKRTKTDEYSEFQFLGHTYTVAILRCASVVKVYEDSPHAEIKLVKDRNDRLFVYAYQEEVRFDSDRDREDNKWSLVSSIQDADLFVKNNNPLWGRIPSVYLSETGYVHVEEYIENQ